MDNLVKGLKIEMLPENYRAIAEAIGTENFVKLAEVVGGVAGPRRRHPPRPPLPRRHRMRIPFSSTILRSRAGERSLKKLSGS